MSSYHDCSFVIHNTYIVLPDSIDPGLLPPVAGYSALPHLPSASSTRQQQQHYAAGAAADTAADTAAAIASDITADHDINYYSRSNDAESELSESGDELSWASDDSQSCTSDSNPELQPDSDIPETDYSQQVEQQHPQREQVTNTPVRALYPQCITSEKEIDRCTTDILDKRWNISGIDDQGDYDVPMKLKPFFCNQFPGHHRHAYIGKGSYEIPPKLAHLKSDDPFRKKAFKAKVDEKGLEKGRDLLNNRFNINLGTEDVRDMGFRTIILCIADVCGTAIRKDKMAEICEKVKARLQNALGNNECQAHKLWSRTGRAGRRAATADVVYVYLIYRISSHVLEPNGLRLATGSY